MALRLDDSVLRGELDNTVRGRVSGRLWLLGQEQPVTLDLKGDCWRDLAGRRTTFSNPNPRPAPRQTLAGPQAGQVGDITASRKVRVPALPLDEWLNRRRLGLDAPEYLGNALYLEWYSEDHGRVVIESATFALQVSLPEWEMTVEEEADQRRRNAAALRHFLDRIEAQLCPDGPPRVPEDRAMDEFEWERFFRASDARSERFGELLEKYGDHPDRDRIVAREMGWHELLEALDARAESGDAADAVADDWDPPDMADLDDEPEPDPEGEGVDWIRDGHGGFCHPLQHRCHELAVRMFREAHASIGREEQALPPDSPLHDMVFQVQCTAAKLAGALSGFGHGYMPEAGFLVAYLKRALGYLHQGLAEIERVEAAGLMPDRLPEYRRELLAVRDGITDLMNRFRHETP
jgi:hypothetical protein